jgi:hypothetical protein
LPVTLLAEQPALLTPEQFFRLAGAGLRGIEQQRSAYWQPHIANSRRRILEAASLCGRHSTVLVLGAGNCTEIPLEELARRFDEVVLLDLDGASMAAAVEELPDELIPKVHLSIADVTRFAAPLMQRLWRAVDESENAAQAFERIAAALHSVEASDPLRALPDADLIVSSLVLSELHRYPLNYAARIVRDKFGKRLADWNGYAHFRAGLRNLALRDHVGLMARSCRRGGAVYFADTIARGPVYEAIAPAQRAETVRAMLPDLVRLGLFEYVQTEGPVRTAFAAAFEKIRPRWNGGDPQAPDRTRRVLKQLPQAPQALPEPDQGAACETIVNLLCNERFDVIVETRALERLLALYSSVPDSFENLVPLETLQAEWNASGLKARGSAESWWWLEYPCSIAYSSGAFQIRSWILQPGD